MAVGGEDDEFGAEPVYKGGARLLVSDARSRTTRRQFVLVEARVSRSGVALESGGASAALAPVGDRRMLVRAQEPSSKGRASAVVSLRELNAARYSSEDAEACDAVKELEVWLGKGDPKPSGASIARALGVVLCGSLTREGFKLFCDRRESARQELAEERSAARRASSAAAESRSAARREAAVAAAAASGGLLLMSSAAGTLGAAGDAAQAGFEASRRMKEDTRSRSVVVERPLELGAAELAIKASRSELNDVKQQRAEGEVVARARHETALKAMQASLAEKAAERATNRQYKVMINEALQVTDLTVKLEGKEKRDRVRHSRDLARLKWSMAPFHNSKTWVKGTVIGPGPMPIRALALMRKEQHDELRLVAEGSRAPSTTSHARAPVSPVRAPRPNSAHPAQPSLALNAAQELTQRQRLQRCFDVVRELARTADEYYLDFDAAFARLDRRSRGFFARADLEFMMGGLYVTEADLDMLWTHFDRNKSGFVEKDDLVYAFYGQRQLLRAAQDLDESAAFRSTVLERVAKQAARQRSTADVRVRVRLIALRGLKGLPAAPLSAFCVVSCCSLSGEEGGGDQETLVISDERRTRDAAVDLVGDEASVAWTARRRRPSRRHVRRRRANNQSEDEDDDEEEEEEDQIEGEGEDEPSAEARGSESGRGRILFKRGTMQQRRQERLLVEVRANHAGARSDVHSLFLGEIFYPLLDLDAATNAQHDGASAAARWIDLKHGDHGGQVRLQVELCAPSGDDDEWANQAFAEDWQELEQEQAQEEELEGEVEGRLGQAKSPGRASRGSRRSASPHRSPSSRASRDEDEDRETDERRRAAASLLDELLERKGLSRPRKRDSPTAVRREAQLELEHLLGL